MFALCKSVLDLLMRDTDRSYLESVAGVTRSKLKTGTLNISIRFPAIDDVQIKGSGTGGWKVKIGTVADSEVEIHLWYDQFIGYPHRRLWVGFYSPDVRQIQRYANRRRVTSKQGPLNSINLMVGFA